MLERFFPFIVIAVFYVIANPIVRRMTGIDMLYGWRFWIYDSPAYLTGIAMGYFLLKNGFLH
jgi:hypothetical protein